MNKEQEILLNALAEEWILSADEEARVKNEWKNEVDRTRKVELEKQWKYELGRREEVVDLAHKLGYTTDFEGCELDQAVAKVRDEMFRKAQEHKSSADVRINHSTQGNGRKEENMRKTYTLDETNERGENEFTIEVSYTYNDGSRTNLLHLWWLYGWTDFEFESYVSVDTYVKDADGVKHHDRYNPTVSPRSRQLNFDYVMEADAESEEWLINKAVAMFRQGVEDVNQLAD